MDEDMETISMIPVFYIILTLLLPVVVIWRVVKKKTLLRPYLFSVGSFLFCATAIIEEINIIKKRLLSGDIGGIEDTIDAVLAICIILLFLTVFFNVLAL